MIKLSLPEDVSYIIDTLTKAGFKAYAVGGCVRDSVLLKTPNDWDITTSARPDQIKELFNKTIDTGIVHGTVSVVLGKNQYEVTTFRSDGDYLDCRHPETVTYTNEIADDLSRRDFTINAMAYNETEGIFDMFGGLDDLNLHIIKCVGEPEKRFSEDALRMLRAVRFSAQLSFNIEKNTMAAIEKKAKNITKISAERIRDEINKILLSDNVKEAFQILHSTTLLKYILPDFDECFFVEQNIKYHLYNVAVHSLFVTEGLEKKLYLRYSGLLHDIGKPLAKGQNDDGTDHFRNHAKISTEIAKKIMTGLRLDNKTIDKALRIIKYHDREILPEKKAVKRAILTIGDDIFLDLLNFRRAEVFAQNTLYTIERLEVYNEIERLYNEIKTQKEPFSLKELDINGNDLMALGYSGKEIGIILNNILLCIINNPEDNKKKKIIQIIKKNINKWLKND